MYEKLLAVDINGYTDSTGSMAYNHYLSKQRASRVRDQFLALGVDPDVIHIRGYGESQPVASNKTAVGRALNRRVEVVARAHQRVVQ